MDFDHVRVFEDGVIVKGVRNFELEHVFECGQCFRWNRNESGSYVGVACGKVIEVEKKDENLIIRNVSEEEFKDVWVHYFDLYRDYGRIKEVLSKDPILKESVEYGNGIRILKQDPFELVISFIISANNRIPMIKRAIESISRKYGKPMIYKGKTYHAFPDIEDMKNASVEDIESCGTGFRAKYIVDTVKKICEGNANGSKEYDLERIKALNDDECHSELQKFSGIGPKVADCIMLFSMQKYSAFPVDVWVKVAMTYFYLAPDVSLKKIREFGRDKFGEFSGFAQQYLFYYARENKLVVK